MNLKPTRQSGSIWHQIACSVLPLVLLSATASAQDFEKEYEKALLDSAYRYELIKPAYLNLKNAYEFTTKENQGWKMQFHLMSFERENDKASFAEQIDKEKRKTRTARRLAFGLTILGIIAAVR